MKEGTGFWSGMPAGIKVRFVIGLVFLAVALVVLSQAPLAGIALLMLPILWTVFVIWLGIESGVGFGPFSQKRETAFSYTLRYVWHASRLARTIFATLVAVIVVGGLGWISTEGLRVEAAKPTLTERVTQTADAATESTRKSVGGWVAKAKGWFTSEE